MSEQVATRSCRIEARAAKIDEELALPNFAFPPECTTAIVDALGLKGEGARGALHLQLNQQAKNYLLAKALLEKHGKPNPQKALVKRIEKAARRLEADLGRLSPELHALIDHRLPSRRNQRRSMIGIRGDLQALADASQTSFRAYRPAPGRWANAVLRTSIAALVLLFSQITGQRAKVTLKHEGEHNPRLTSPEARAIGAFFRTVDPAVLPTTIANQINAVRKVYPGEKLKRFGPMLMLVTRITPTGDPLPE